jgi:hypothetical protein
MTVTAGKENTTAALSPEINLRCYQPVDVCRAAGAVHETGTNDVKPGEWVVIFCMNLLIS